MHYKYILKSAKTGRYYYGSTENLERRLATHNAGSVRSTCSGAPWTVHYIEEYDMRSDAQKRETYFKKRSGYRWLKQQGIL